MWLLVDGLCLSVWSGIIQGFFILSGYMTHFNKRLESATHWQEQ